MEINDDLVESVVAQFDEVDVSDLQTIGDVIAAVKKCEYILNENGMFTVHHISEAITELDDDDTASITSPIAEEDGSETDYSFVVNYTHSTDGYEVFIDVDFTESVEADLDLSDEDYNDEEMEYED
jgi:hypothetical protein